MDKALNYLSLARKAGRIELGEEPVSAAARAHHAPLILVAGDASDHTWRKAKSLVTNTNQHCIRVRYSKDELGQYIGRTSLAIAAFTDPALALAFLQAMDQPETYGDVLESLKHRTQRIRQRRSEAKAHLRNKKLGRTH